MKYNILLVCGLLISFSSIYAQNPEAVGVQSMPDGPETCTTPQDAGTLSFILTFPTTQSNTVGLNDTTFLCANDSARVIHNGDFDLSGDPNPATPGEVGYGFYDCFPSVFGDELGSVVADPCVINNPPTPNDIWISRASGPGNADLKLFNDGSVNNLFFGGDPGYFILAPITFDVYNAQPQFENMGSCVNVSTGEAFELVYLNPLELMTSNTSGLSGSFQVSGGYPEFNPSGTYTNIEVINVNDNNITGTVTPGNYGQGDDIEISVPEAGDYTVIVEDDKACPLSFQMSFSDQAVVLDVDDATVSLGESFCLPITVNNFDSITSVTFVINFNPNVIEYVDIQNWAFPGDVSTLLVGDTQAENGLVRFIWVSNDVSVGQSLPDGSVLMEICFTTAPGAQVGDQSIVDLISNGPTDLEITGTGSNTIRDVNVNPGTVTIEPDGLSLVSGSCGSLPGRTDGSITVSAFAGTPPYMVSITGPQNDNGMIAADGGSITFPNLPPGMYTVTITDDMGNMTSDMQEVYDGGPTGDPRPNYNFSFIENPSCFDSRDGALGINLINNPDLEPYTIEWSTNQFNLDTITNLGRGTYRLTVTDGFGCEEERNQTLTQSQIVLDTSITPPGCSGYSDGEAIITANGGTPGPSGEYTFTWFVDGGGSATANQATIPNLPEGWFTVQARDDNNCLVVDSFFVTAERVLSFQNLTLDIPTCFEGDDGVIRVTGETIGGPANTPYNIQIIDDAGANRSVPFGPTTGRADNLEAGPYDIVITDQTTPNACVFDTTVELSQPDSIAVDIRTTDETCLVGDDGTATLNPSGGTAPYDFNWPGGLSNSPTQSGLSPGDYSVAITDANGCTTTVSFTINEAMPPQVVNVTEVQPTCPETCDGRLIIEVEPNPNFEIVRYLIQRPGPALDTLTNATTLTVDGFCSGEFYSIFQIEDEAGCIYQPGILSNFPQRDSLELDTIITTNPSCNSLSDGTVEVTLNGGQMPYIYAWDDGRIDTVSGPGFRDDLSDGNYTLTVNDINDCGTIELNFELNEPEPLNVEFININDASCFNTCDGEAVAEASGGPTGPAGYSFQWSSGSTSSGSNTSVANDLCPDEGFVVLSSGSCTDTFFLTIPAPAEITNQLVDSVPPSCFGNSDGSLEVEASGGNGNYIYQWEGGPQNASFTGLGAGTYVVEITDDQNCSLIDSILLEEPDSLVAFFDTADVLNPTCPGEIDGMLTATVFGGNGPMYSYNWEGNISQNEEAAGLDIGTYQLTVSDPNGCSDTTSATLVSNPPISFILPQPDTPNCNGETVSYIIDSVSGGGGAPYQYQISGSPLADIGQALSIEGGMQTVTIIDANGCNVDTLVSVPERQAINITLDPNQEIRLGETLQLFPSASGEFPIVSYQWSPAEGLSCTDCQNPIVTPGGNMTYSLIVTDQNGCTASAITQIRTNTQRDIFIPNVFSPNGDEINDVFQVFSGPGVSRINSFMVFDRWGGLMWEGRNLLPSGQGSPGWNGERNGRDAQPGVYAYKIEIQFLDGRVITYRGDVTLVR